MSGFSAVIPTVGRSEALRDTITSVLACDPLPRELLVVDGSEDRSAEEIVAALANAPIPVRHHSSPRGLTIQRNRGLDAAAGDVVVFLDDDVDLEPDVFAHLARAYEDPNVIGATGRVIEPDAGRVVGKESSSKRFLFGGGAEGGFTRFGYPRRIIDLTQEQDVAFMQGCFMSVRRDIGIAVGFDENMTGYALAEDEDFSYRLSRRGRIRFLPQAVVRHKNLGFGTRDGRTFGRQVVVNRTYLFRKNFPRPPAARIQFAVFICLLIVHRLLNREWSEVRGLLEGSVAALRSRG
jgi:glycosyltransferase involved in cell wall biosynthesis